MQRMRKMKKIQESSEDEGRRPIPEARVRCRPLGLLDDAFGKE